MPPFFSNRKLIILLTSLILLVALIGFSMKDRKQLSWPEQFAHDTVGWFQFVFNKPAQYVAGFFENIGEIKDVYEENKQLKSHLRDYAELHAKYADLDQKFAKLQSQLNIGDMPGLADDKKRIATVIGRSFDGWNQLITVNKGSQQGIKKGMAVITPEGFIGKVTGVSQFTSVVTLITDQLNSNQIAAKVVSDGKNPIFGMIEGYDPKTGSLLFKKIKIDAKIKKGDDVITSGLGGVYPARLPIGKVVSVKPDQYGLTKTAEVKPSADFNNIVYVDIIERSAASSGQAKEGNSQ